MKTYRKIFIMVGVAVLSLSSCDTTLNLDEINTDPNRPSLVPTAGIFTRLQREIAFEYCDDWSGIRIAGIPSQHWSQIQYDYEDIYNYASRTSVVTNYFNWTYRMSELANKIIQINEDTPELASASGDNAAQIATVRIIKAWLIMQNVEVFGDIPYTQANNLTEFPLAKYDTQETIFKGIIQELKEANTQLLTANKGWVSGDVMFGGDLIKWSRFANSLRLRVAMRMSNIEPTLSAKEAALAISDGVMESNEDNATFYFTGAASPVQAPLSAGYASRNDFTLSWQFTNLMAGEDDAAISFLNPFAGKVDPRLYQMTLSTDSITKATAVSMQRVVGMPYGLDQSNKAIVWPEINTVQKVAVNYSTTGRKQDSQLAKPVWSKFWSTFMDYTNVALFIAELNDDRAFFQKGVQASLSMWGVLDAEATAYLTHVMSKYDAAGTQDARLEMIITQKYIHNFAHADLEAWSEYRRTEYPNSFVRPGEQTGPSYTIGGVATTFTFTTSSLTHGTRVIDRMMYSLDESTENRENLDAAIVSMGGDAQNIPLWWSLAYKKK